MWIVGFPPYQRKSAASVGVIFFDVCVGLTFDLIEELSPPFVTPGQINSGQMRVSEDILRDREKATLPA